MMLQLIRPGMTVFDVGANIGWYSLNVARLMAGVQVHAFEPLPSTFGYLARNVALNSFTNIHLHHFGFSNKADTLTFYFYPEGSGNASATDLGSSPHKQEIPLRGQDPGWLYPGDGPDGGFHQMRCRGRRAIRIPRRHRNHPNPATGHLH